MKSKFSLVLKLSILLFALVMVVLVREVSNSGGFKKSVNDLFGIEPVQKLNWCADHVVDVVWTSPDVPEKLKSLDMGELRDNYCQLKTEAISGIDLDKLTWASLAESHGATGLKTLLEWNSASEVFRSGGMPFKSSGLYRQLVDK
jgi:hypothetical protein